MTYRIDVKIDTDVYDAIIEAVQEAPALMTGFIDNLVAETQQKIGTEYLVLSSNFPRLPFIWSHDAVKQKRARGWYFANKVKKGSTGGRYRRTGQLIANTTIRAVKGTSTLIIIEYPDAGRYVFGDRQVPSHRETGHPNISEEIPKINAELTERTIDAWFAFTNPFEGAI